MEKRKINIPWLFDMAWRDSRRNRSRLMLFISAIIFGIAALVAIYSFRYNLEADINSQAASLVGADLVVYSGKLPDKQMQHLLDSLGDERSQERMFVSMVYFPKGGGTRLVQVHALQGAFPYYGSLETVPVAAGAGGDDHRPGHRHGPGGHSQAAPRAPLASPCFATKTGVSASLPNTYSFKRRGRF